MKRTVSEQLFESYCAAHGYSCMPIPKCDRPTPDYRVTAGNRDVLVEVKELRPNEDDRRFADELRRYNFSIHGDLPGRRAAEAIKDAASQLKASNRWMIPTLVVLFDNVIVEGESVWGGALLDGAQIDFGMFGLQTVELGTGRHGRGGRRQLRDSHRVHVSAVAVLYRSYDQPFLAVYHNWFANPRLPFSVFAGAGDRHFVKPAHPDECPQQWVEVNESGVPARP